MQYALSPPARPIIWNVYPRSNNTFWFSPWVWWHPVNGHPNRCTGHNSQFCHWGLMSPCYWDPKQVHRAEFQVLSWAPVSDPNSRMTSASRDTIVYSIFYILYIIYYGYCTLALSAPSSSRWLQFAFLTLVPDVILLLNEVGNRCTGIIHNSVLGTCFEPFTRARNRCPA